MTAHVPPRPSVDDLRRAADALDDTVSGLDPYDPDTAWRQGQLATVIAFLNALAEIPDRPERPAESPATEHRYRRTVYLTHGDVAVSETASTPRFDAWVDALAYDRSSPHIDRVEIHGTRVDWGTDLAPQLLRLQDRRTGDGCTRCGRADPAGWHRPRCLNPDPPAETGI